MPRHFMGLWLWLLGAALHWYTHAWLLFVVESLILFWGGWKQQSRMPKWIGWASVPFFAIWFVSLPSGLFWGYTALAIFFHWLAILQWVGGQKRFVWVNGAIALGFLFYWWSFVALLFAFLWIGLIWSHSAKGKFYKSFFLQVLLSICLTALLWWASSLIPSMSGRSWSANQVIGFSANSILGSFQESYSADRQDQVVLRVFSPYKMDYLQGLVYQRYQSGIWHRTDSLTWVEYPQKRLGEYALYGSSLLQSYPPIWVQVAKSTEGYLFINRGSTQLAIDADSLLRGKWGGIQAPEGYRERGYYMDHGSTPNTPISPEDLQVPKKLLGFMDSVSQVLEIDTVNPKFLPRHLLSVFQTKFRYSLHVELQAGQDPLRTFFKTREGYCEYFASFAVILLRSKGIPARYVTGFAFPESIGGAWVYREQNAHAWLEYFQENQWNLLDVTPPSYTPIEEMGVAQQYSEKILAWIQYRKHQILDGLWRESLENGSAWIRKNRFWILMWIFIPLLLIGLLVWFWKKKHKLKRQSDIDIVQRLLAAETLLRQKGFYRPSSMPVGIWMQQLPSNADQQAMHLLQEYQMNRFKKSN